MRFVESLSFFFTCFSHHTTWLWDRHLLWDTGVGARAGATETKRLADGTAASIQGGPVWDLRCGREGT